VRGQKGGRGVGRRGEHKKQRNKEQTTDTPEESQEDTNTQKKKKMKKRKGKKTTSSYDTEKLPRPMATIRLSAHSKTNGDQ